jgi:hypothetical protein
MPRATGAGLLSETLPRLVAATVVTSVVIAGPIVDASEAGPAKQTQCGLTVDGSSRIVVAGITCVNARPLAERLERTGKCAYPFIPAASVLGCLTFGGKRSYVLIPVVADGWVMSPPW